MVSKCVWSTSSTRRILPTTRGHLTAHLTDLFTLLIATDMTTAMALRRPVVRPIYNYGGQATLIFLNYSLKPLRWL